MLTFAIATTPSNKLIAMITDRMPAVLPRQHGSKWLGEGPATPEVLKAMLVPYEDNRDWDMAPSNRPSRPARRRRPARGA